MRSAAWGVRVSDELTVGEFLVGILPRLKDHQKFPSWPPDCFGLCLALLKRSGAYAQLLRDWPPERDKDDALRAWTDNVRKLGEKWRRSWPSEAVDDLAGEWQVVCQSFEVPLGQTRERHTLCEALMKLVAVADEASGGVGAPRNQTVDRPAGLPDFAASYLTELGTL